MDVEIVMKLWILSIVILMVANARTILKYKDNGRNVAILDQMSVGETVLFYAMCFDGLVIALAFTAGTAYVAYRVLFP